MKTILLIFGTRPEIIKLAPVYHALKKTAGLRTLTCNTGQHKSLLDDFITELDISIDADLAIMTENQSLPELSALCIRELSAHLSKVNPDLVLVQGDTTTAAMGALAAFYAKIPVAHVEAGMRSGERYSPFPEEVNRRLISQLATLHFAATEDNRDCLYREGVAADSIFVTGNTVVDVLHDYKMKLSMSPAIPEDLRSLPKELFHQDPMRKIVLITVHRRESFGTPLQQIVAALRSSAEKHAAVHFILPVHPNPNVRPVIEGALGSIKNFHLLPPIAYQSILFLLTRAAFVVTDSGGLQEEAPSFGLPVLVMRGVTERREGIGRGIARLVGSDSMQIAGAISDLLENSDRYNEMVPNDNPYGDGKAAPRIVSSIAAYLA